jgi:hypothetical protein
VAQIKEQMAAEAIQVIEVEINKESTDAYISEQIKDLKKDGIFVKISKIKRNKNNEITQIFIKFKDNEGNTVDYESTKDEPIENIYIYKEFGGNKKIGIGTKSVFDKHGKEYLTSGNFKSIYNSQFESDTEDNLERLFIINGKPYTKEDLKGKNIAIIDADIIKLSPKEALQKYGKKAKDGAVIFKGETEIINNVLDADFPAPPPPPPAPPVTRKTTSDINQEKNRFYIINGKEYFQNDLKGYTLKCDGSITYYDEEEAIKKFGEKAKDGAMVFNGVTSFEKKNITTEIQERKTIIFSNDNGDDIVFIPAEKILKLPGYPSARLNDGELVLIVNGVQKTNPLETLNQMNLQNVKSIRVYDENGKETPGSKTKKIVITTK